MSSQISQLDFTPWRTLCEIGARVATTLQQGLAIGAASWHAADGLSHHRPDEIPRYLIRYRGKELRKATARWFDKSVNCGLRG